MNPAWRIILCRDVSDRTVIRKKNKKKGKKNLPSACQASLPPELIKKNLSVVKENEMWKIGRTMWNNPSVPDNCSVILYFIKLCLMYHGLKIKTWLAKSPGGFTIKLQTTNYNILGFNYTTWTIISDIYLYYLFYLRNISDLVSSMSCGSS